MLRRGDLLGHFEILGALGAGGMGEVYVARDQHLGRKVAVKVLPDSIAANPEALERLEREAKTLAGISHPNILTIHDFASEGTVRFAVTELLDGEDLRKRLGREGAMPLEEALHVAIAVARGLASAHEHHVVHRDVKPANVFLESSGGVKVLDFGLARSEVADLGDEAKTAARVTRPGVLMGTVGYMSPEQIRGQTAGPASDVFSLGCLLYEMLTGKRPFDRPTTGDTLAATLAAPPTPVAEHGVSIHAPLRRILERALAKDPATRYPTAIEMCAELEAYSDGLVETPSARRLLVATLRRPRVALPLLLLVAVLTFLGVRAVSRSSGERWARQTALPEVRRLVDSGEQAAAYALASEAEAKIIGDAGLEELFAAISERLDVTTEPPGAEVWVQRYAEPESEWRRVGTTPLTGLRMPLGIF
ncbi:MAG TPA: serine/threonine-protein kinase, partial [Thermoanaerobaculia bacterium]|nr:serine/threonine-protein kinase [Thermoanaerobaculia bacterium]